MTATIMKKTKNLKTWLGLLKNMGGNFPGRNSPEGGGNFPGGNFPGETIMDGNFPGGN